MSIAAVILIAILGSLLFVAICLLVLFVSMIIVQEKKLSELRKISMGLRKRIFALLLEVGRPELALVVEGLVTSAEEVAEIMALDQLMSEYLARSGPITQAEAEALVAQASAKAAEIKPSRN